jgi:hypothetical protein
VGGPDDRGPVLPELTRQKRWMLALVADLLAEAGLGRDDDGALARQLMLLHEGALVTLGMATFPRPVETARDLAAVLIAGARRP